MTRWTSAYSRSLQTEGIIAVNIHRIPAENRAEAAERIRSLADLGESFDPAHPEAPAGQRRLMIGFYDGYRETAFWGAEVCAELGLRAHFFPIFVGSIPGQAELDDDDLRRLAGDHEIGYHTSSHLPAVEITEANLQAEVLQPVERIAAITGRTPLIAAWRGGTRFDSDTLGDATLRALGIRYLVSNWSIETVLPPTR